MDYIFLDESGDLGFSRKGSSKYFLIATMMVRNNIPIRRLVKKTRKKMLKQKRKGPSELKANKSSSEIRRYVLNLLSQEDIKICCVVINKNKVYKYLRKRKEKLYNYIVKHILINIEPFLSHDVNIVIDKRCRKRLVRQDLNNYIKKVINLNNRMNIRVSHIDSQKSEELQALDFICWSIFRKYEHDDISYYEIIKNKILSETQLWGFD